VSRHILQQRFHKGISLSELSENKHNLITNNPIRPRVLASKQLVIMNNFGELRRLKHGSYNYLLWSNAARRNQIGNLTLQGINTVERATKITVTKTVTESCTHFAESTLSALHFKCFIILQSGLVCT